MQNFIESSGATDGQSCVRQAAMSFTAKKAFLA